MKIRINPNRPFTTFEVAKICRVFHTTVINWVNKGQLKAYATPGRHRRILLEDLLEFMKRFDMPIPANLESHPKRVLVVDDDPSIQRLLARLLRAVPGIELQMCSSGLEALLHIGKEAPDLLVLDIRIPQVNGLELCKLLSSNEQTRPIHIVAISGEALSKEDEDFVRRHCDCYYRKPLSTSELKEKVMDLLDLDDAPSKTV